MELVGSDEAAANAEKVIEDFRKNKLPVIYIQHISEYEGKPRSSYPTQMETK